MLSEEKIAELKSSYGELACVDSPSGPLVFRKPNRTEFDRWFDKNASSKSESSKHARELVKSCRVYPDEAGLDAALEKTPAILCCEVLTAVTGLAGLQETFAVKRL
jgi:hypothetical protein